MAKFLYKIFILNILLSFNLNCCYNPFDNTYSLHYHCSKGSTSIANLLIKAGHDINAKNKHGDTPLHKAVFANNILAIILLLKNKADTNILNKNGETPIFKANSELIIKMLLNNKAKLNITNKYGQTPLHLSKSAPERLINSFSLNKQDLYKNTALYYAVLQNNPYKSEDTN